MFTVKNKHKGSRNLHKQWSDILIYYCPVCAPDIDNVQTTVLFSLVLVPFWLCWYLIKPFCQLTLPFKIKSLSCEMVTETRTEKWRWKNFATLRAPIHCLWQGGYTDSKYLILALRSESLALPHWSPNVHLISDVN